MCFKKQNYKKKIDRFPKFDRFELKGHVVYVFFFFSLSQHCATDMVKITDTYQSSLATELKSAHAISAATNHPCVDEG